MRWPALRLDLRYLVTVWAQAVDDEHRLLFHLYRTLRRLAEVPEEAREGAMENQTKALHVLVEDGELKGLVDLWGVLDNRMQPGFVLKATVAVDLNGAREAPMVRTSTIRAGRFGYPAETRHRIGGTVVDGEGRPVAGARVLVGGRFAETGEDGRFNIAPLPPGELEVEVEAPGFAGAGQPVSAPANYDVTLQAESESGGARRSGGRRRGGGGR
jgi:hypothetical protein